MHDRPDENRWMNADEDATGGTPWRSPGTGGSHGVPPVDRAGAESLVSAQDVEDADDILFAHPPRVVTRWLCGCGEDYPCPEVRFARLVRAVHATATATDTGTGTEGGR